jgi:hypothetical protein
MIDVAKFPYLTGRKGSSNLYYRRLVPLDLRAAGRPGQVWRSLRTSDRKKAEAAYGAKRAEVEALFAQWRRDDAQPVGSFQSQLPAKGTSNFVPLTPALLRRLADAHYSTSTRTISSGAVTFGRRFTRMKTLSGVARSSSSRRMTGTNAGAISTATLPT